MQLDKSLYKNEKVLSWLKRIKERELCFIVFGVRTTLNAQGTGLTEERGNWIESFYDEFRKNVNYDLVCSRLLWTTAILMIESNDLDEIKLKYETCFKSVLLHHSIEVLSVFSKSKSTLEHRLLLIDEMQGIISTLYNFENDADFEIKMRNTKLI